MQPMCDRSVRRTRAAGFPILTSRGEHHGDNIPRTESSPAPAGTYKAGNGITLVGSIVGTRTDLREVFELHAAGKTKVIRDVRSLDQVNESIADVDGGRVAARIVFEP